MVEINLDYLVVGAGRSGTGSTAKMLTINNIRCGHERMFGLQIRTNIQKFQPKIKPSFVAESSWLAVPHLNSFNFTNTNLIHVVRNPIDVIRSFYTLGFFRQKTARSPYVKTITRQIPDLDLSNPIDSNIRYLLKWDELITASYDRFKTVNLLKVEEIDKCSLNEKKEHIIVNQKTKHKTIDITRQDIIDLIRVSPYFEVLTNYMNKYGYEF